MGNSFSIHYSVMQSDGNSFCGNVDSDNFKKTSRDVDNVLDQVYKIKNVHIIIDDFNSS